MKKELDPIDRKELRSALLTELLYRREKQWKVFSWTTTLLIGAIAGVFALAIKDGRELSILQKCCVAAPLIVLSIYASYWLDENVKREQKARASIEDIDSTVYRMVIIEKFREQSAYYGYGPVIWSICGVAMATIFFTAPLRHEGISLTFKPDRKPNIVLALPNGVEYFDDLSNAIVVFEEKTKKN